MSDGPAEDLRFLAARVSATQEPQPVPARGGRKRGVAIASVIALAVVSTAAGGILITHRDKSVEAASFADLYRNVSSGVVRIKANSCGGGEGANGTGFLIAPNLVATVAHVVNGSASLNLTIGEKGAGGTTSGVLVGVDPKVDVALVRLDHPVRGHVFTMASSSPLLGQEVAAIGFPEGDPMTSTRGIVSGLDRALTDPDFMRSGLIETDADVLSGYSGAPLLSADGQVIGLVDAGDEGGTYSVAATDAQPLLKSWVGKTSAVSAPCDNPAGP
jgi:serine protease Do